MVGKEGTLSRRLRLIMLDFVLESVLLVVLVLELGNRGLIEGGKMATTVKITETYDLKTTLNKMGIIGVHTPSDSLLRKLYPGLMKNHRFVRFLSCDIVGACASVLPADPLQVGVSAGDVAPEDMFNPILLKAVSNEAFENVMMAVYDGGQTVGALGSLDSAQIHPNGDQFTLYYNFLASKGGWKKALPQRGFGMSKLVPICHQLISTYGNTARQGNMTVREVVDDDIEVERQIPDIADVGAPDGTTPYDKAVTFRGRSVRMPKIPLHYFEESNSDIGTVNIPKTFVACILTPPARLHEFYYRMRVTWTVRFENVIPTTEYAGWSVLGSVANSYYKGYSSSKAELPESTDMVDTSDVDINKIMES